MLSLMSNFILFYLKWFANKDGCKLIPDEASFRLGPGTNFHLPVHKPDC